MEQETLINILSGRYGEILETHAMWQCISALGIKPFEAGNLWCFCYEYEDTEEEKRIFGCGETIFDAALDFYKTIKTKKVI